MQGFPIIHTNFWDAVIAVPTVVIVTQVFKMFLPIKRIYIPSIANLVGLFISIFFSHRGDLSAGILMGFFYGNAAVGVYSSIKTTLESSKLFKNDKL